LWITPQVDTDLERFEAALRQIGANAHLVEPVPNDPDWNKSIKAMFGTFAKVMGSKGSEGETITEDLAIHTIIGRLRKVLGIEELTDLRRTLLSQALQHHRP
jgi:hypothetical protein